MTNGKWPYERGRTHTFLVFKNDNTASHLELSVLAQKLPLLLSHPIM